MRSVQSLLALLLALLLLGGCASSAVLQPTLTPLPAPQPTPAPVPQFTQPPDQPWQADTLRELSVWATYWDTRTVLNELGVLCAELGAVCYFEAMFDGAGEIVVPPTVDELYASVEVAFPDNAWRSYLTFVNDICYDDGSVSLKDSDFLRDVFATPERTDAHMRDILACARQRGFDGVEIDYEGMGTDAALWEPFLRFCAALCTEAQRQGLAVRVVLEPGAPYDAYAFPEGPDYVVMCYNLHGGHSDPGPKADFAFLDKLMDKAAAGGFVTSCGFALATGGYDWCGGAAEQVTLHKARALLQESGVRAVRDAASHALYFEYTDEAKKRHTLWYADEETLKAWRAAIRARGYNDVSLWRLGGNLVY